MRVLVFGASGGIGRAIAANLSRQGHNVVGTYHRQVPDETGSIDWAQVDVTVDSEIKSLFADFEHCDWIINAVGLLHDKDLHPEKTIKRLDPKKFLSIVEVNTLPTLLLAKHGGRALKASAAPRFAAISAKVGSISDNRLGGWYSYRISKAALNMAIKTISIEWQHAMPDAAVAALHPGTVATPLSAPYSKNAPRLLSPEESAVHLVGILDGLSPADSGKFWSWNGEELPW